MAREEIGVASRLASITMPPDRNVSPGSEAAGCTSALVPTMMQRSASRAAQNAAPMTSASSDSPNQMTSGRRMPPHEPHLGSVAVDDVSTVDGPSVRRAQREHRSR